MSRASDQAMLKLCETLAQEIGAGVDFEVALGELVGKYRRRFDRVQQDAEAAKLLPLGAEVVMERQDCCRATAYNRAKRARRLSKLFAAG